MIDALKFTKVYNSVNNVGGVMFFLSLHII